MPSSFDTETEEGKIKGAREHEEEDLTRMLAEKYGIQYLDLSGIPIDTEALRLISEKDAREAEAAAIAKTGKKVSLAVRNPQNSSLPALMSGLAERGFLPEQLLVSSRGLEKAFARYAELSFATETKRGTFDIAGDDLARLSASLVSIGAVRELLSQTTTEKMAARTSRLLEEILAGALALKASDIHLEPQEKEVRLRFRLDGVLTDVFGFDAAAYRFLASRVKILSGLKLNVRDRAQDGRFSITVGGKEVEVRVSLIPENYGETFVMRILDPSTVGLSLDQLGIHPKLLVRLEKEIMRPNGLLLTTGPTGSGKTTTLYAFIKKIYAPDIKIVTIEDPIEYHLPGIVQTQVEAEKYTFASGLRSIVRQDPDIIMVGEIRDGETAAIAIQAALTGHFVFSTLHTNNAAGTFPRLADLGADPKEFGSAITVAMAQRLVRVLDPETKTKRKATDEEKKLMERIFATLTDKETHPASFDEVWSAAPKSADDTGYRGRTGVREAIFMDDELSEFLRGNPSSGEIERATRRQGYLTMAQDGVVKALSGETSLEEVLRVVDLPRD